MDPWIELSCAYTQAGDKVALRQRADCFEIRLNGWELMSNRSHHSEEIMAVLACEQLAGDAPVVLVGGLGMGYTLRARGAPSGTTSAEADGDTGRLVGRPFTTV